MKIVIEAEPKEIADLVLALQGQRNQGCIFNIGVKEFSQRLSQSLGEDCKPNH